jgi:hypothetical protein
MAQLLDDLSFCPEPNFRVVCSAPQKRIQRKRNWFAILRRHINKSISGLVVKSPLAMRRPRVRFPADASRRFFLQFWSEDLYIFNILTFVFKNIQEKGYTPGISLSRSDRIFYCFGMRKKGFHSTIIKKDNSSNPRSEENDESSGE